MVLMGIDPGLAAMGYGVVLKEGPRCVALAHGCVRTPAESELGDRLMTLHTVVGELVREHRPAVLVLEQLYQVRDGSTGLAIGQAIGVIRLAAAQAGLGVAEYSPTHVKLALVGNGQATKHQIQFMVQRLLGLDEPPKPDHAADALALCVCHLHSGMSRAAGPGGGRGSDASAADSRVAAALAAEDERRRRFAARRETE